MDVYFDFVLASRDLGIEKPNPLIFQRAIELAAADARTGILPQEALHVGDHIKKDYEAARVSLRMKLIYEELRNYCKVFNTKNGIWKFGTEKTRKFKCGDFLCVNRLDFA